MSTLQRIKTFRTYYNPDKPDPNSIDNQVNQWVEETGNEIVWGNASVVRVGALLELFYTVCYRTTEPAIPASDFRGTVVCREVDRLEDGKVVGHDYCMAGAFPVPEMHALSSDDEESAPAPLLSPDFDLTPYSEWFSIPEAPVCRNP